MLFNNDRCPHVADVCTRLNLLAADKPDYNPKHTGDRAKAKEHRHKIQAMELSDVAISNHTVIAGAELESQKASPPPAPAPAC